MWTVKYVCMGEGGGCTDNNVITFAKIKVHCIGFFLHYVVYKRQQLNTNWRFWAIAYFIKLNMHFKNQPATQLVNNKSIITSTINCLINRYKSITSAIGLLFSFTRINAWYYLIINLLVVNTAFWIKFDTR